MGLDTLVVSSRRIDPRLKRQLSSDVLQSIVYEPGDLLSRARLALTGSAKALHATRRVMRGSRKIHSPYARPELQRPSGTGRFELPLEMAIANRLGFAIEKIAEEYGPSLIHALRIPFEGISAASAASRWPLAVSIWGQDLVAQAPAHPKLATASRNLLGTIVALHADCQRDIQLAQRWHSPSGIPTLVAAGNMGFDPTVFHPGRNGRTGRDLVVYPRGASTFINYVGSLQAAANLMGDNTQVTFIGVRLKGNPIAEAIRASSRDPSRMVLTGTLNPDQLADLYRRAIAVVSPAISDGTPNSILEGMACGALPIVGDIPSLRELLGDGALKPFIDPLDAGAITHAIRTIVALDREQWEQSSACVQHLATSKWSIKTTLGRVHAWYEAALA